MALAIALGPCLVLLAYYAGSYLWFAGSLALYPFDLDQGEGYDAWSAWLIDRGSLPYSDNSRYPYYSSNYPPLWSYVVSIPMAWTGPGLGPGRAVSTLAALAVAAVLGLAAARRAGVALGGVLAAGFFLASPYVYHATPLARVNSLTLLFAAVALALLERTTSRRLVLGVLALLAAMFTKQTAFDAAAAGLGYAFLQRPRAALVAGLALVLSGVAAMGALLALTGGAFWLNVVAGNANPFDLWQLLVYVANFLEVHGILLVLAIGEVVLVVRGRASLSPWVLYLFAAALVSLTVGKWGAGESYFLGVVAATSVLGGSFAARLLTTPSRGRLVPVITAGLLLVQALLMARGPLSAAVPWLPDRGPQAAQLGRVPTDTDRRAGEEIVAQLRAGDGPVLVEDPSFAVAAGKPVIGNATHLRNLYQAGLWSPEPLVTELEERRYDVVVLDAQLYPEPVLAAIGRYYYLQRVISLNGVAYQIFLPGAD